MANDVSKCELSSNVVCCMCSVGRVIIFDCHTTLSVTVVLWSTMVVFVEDGSSLREQRLIHVRFIVKNIKSYYKSEIHLFVTSINPYEIYFNFL